jgi:frataxin-like iron-binding protein CyaY
MAIGRSDYEERKEQRIEYLEEKAVEASKEAGQYEAKAHRIGSVIPFGQPILAGHHSERHHRAVVNKIETALHTSVEANEKAEYYQARAEAAMSNNAISGDDPEAISRYKEKLEKLEVKQEKMKSVNAYWRKHKTMKGYSGMSNAEAEKIDDQMKTAYSWVQKSGPYESWRLSNNNAEIRRIKEKLESLKELDGMAAETINFSGGVMRVNVEINRVQFIFEEKPSDEVRSLLKSNGFKWAPSKNAWQRQRTLNAVKAARSLISKLSNGELKKVSDA